MIRPGDEDLAAEAIEASGLLEGPERSVEVTHGGSTRHRSELAALEVLRGRILAGALDVVAIHDGARPLAGPALLAEVIRVAAEHGGAVPTIPETDAWRLDDGLLRPPATSLQRVQTPQAFRAASLLAAYAQAAEGTDTAAAFEGVAGVRVVAVPGHQDNVKVTFTDDVGRVEAPTPAGAPRGRRPAGATVLTGVPAPGRR